MNPLDLIRRRREPEAPAPEHDAEDRVALCASCDFAVGIVSGERPPCPFCAGRTDALRFREVFASEELAAKDAREVYG